MNVDEKVDSIDKDIKYFEVLIQGSEKLIKPWKTAVLALVVGWVLTIAAFIFFLLQFNFSSSNEATGVYAMIDSDGNIVAQDVSPEQWDSYIEWSELNGNSQEEKHNDQEKG